MTSISSERSGSQNDDILDVDEILNQQSDCSSSDDKVEAIEKVLTEMISSVRLDCSTSDVEEHSNSQDSDVSECSDRESGAEINTMSVGKLEDSLNIPPVCQMNSTNTPDVIWKVARIDLGPTPIVIRTCNEWDIALDTVKSLSFASEGDILNKLTIIEYTADN